MHRIRFAPSWTVTLTLAAAMLGILGLSLFATLPAAAVEIETDFPFELDKWYDLDFEDGPVTLHRVRVVAQKSNVKSRLFRPSNSEFSETVQIQVEYTNTADKDYEADIDIVWVDAKGNEIDGYRDEEGIDEDEHDEMTMTFSTLRYGLEQAKTLRVKIRL